MHPNKLTEEDLNLSRGSLIEISQIDFQEELPIYKKVIQYINTEEYWPLWVGIIWFLVVLGYSFWGLDMPKFSTWHDLSTFTKIFTL